MNDIDAILEILPHRYPFLMVDRILECDDKENVTAIKNVTINEPFFQGHFPGRPIMPGVLQLEAMAQTGGILLSRQTGIKGLIPLFMAVDKARFRRPIIPGDTLRIEAKLLNRRARVARMQARIYVEDKLASEAELLFTFTTEKAPA